MLFLIFLFSFLNKATEEKIILKGLEYAPQDLKLIIKDHFIEFKKGIRDGKEEKMSSEEIEKKISLLINHFKEKKRVEIFVYEIGKLSSGIMYILNTIPLSEDKIFLHIKKDFPLYVENKIKKFPIVFYGFKKEIFYGKIVEEMEKEREYKREYLPLLKYGYLKGDLLLDRFSFDDRSNAFGVGQIFVNKSFSFLLNIWYYIWIKNGGRWGPLNPYQTNKKIWVLAYGY